MTEERLLFTANYINTDSNFEISNLKKIEIDSVERSLFCVINNILQRGCPTRPSVFLEKSFEKNNVGHKVRLVSKEPINWEGVVKGGKHSNPALSFLNIIIPKTFPDYAFLHNIIIPECPIADIIDDPKEEFVGQSVDFYIPEFALAMEIDGTQHLTDNQKVQDKKRDAALKKHGVQVIRIPASSIINRDESIDKAIKDIRNRIESKAFSLILDNLKKDYSLSPDEIECLLKPVATIRLQVTLIQLLLNGMIKASDEEWRLAIHSREITGYEKAAIEDLLIWIKQLWILADIPFSAPLVKLELVNDFKSVSNDYLKIDLSVYEVATPSYRTSTDVVYVSAAVNQSADYFKVEISNPIVYDIDVTNEEKHQSLLYFLKNIFGFEDGFQPGQERIVANALMRRDTIGVLPTGGGKSLCYQMCMLLQPCISICVAPIKALMIDQHQNLLNLGISRTTYISSDLSSEERSREQWKFAQCRFLLALVSPERFQSEEFRMFISDMSSSKDFHFGYAIIDEVHCLSEWGHSFRVSYLNLIKALRKFCNDITLIGLTATASLNVLKNIQIEFGMDIDSTEDVITVPHYTRENLHFSVKNYSGTSKYEELKNILDSLYKENNSLFTVKGKNTDCGIIFTPNVNGDYGCQFIAEMLCKDYKNRKADIRYFSGQRPKHSTFKNDKAYEDYKRQTQEAFKDNKFPLLVATKAFGIGIDKPNIKYTIHYGIPSSREALYQEAGRAGRDKAIDKADCFVVFSPETEAVRQKLNPVFAPFTPVEQIKRISGEIGFDGADANRQLFLLAKGLVTRKNEIKCAEYVLGKIKKSTGNNIILKADDEESFDILQKVLYHMSVVGIIDDWTVDWKTNAVKAYTNSYDSTSLIEKTKDYISKYSNDEQIDIFQEEIKRYEETHFYEIAIINAFYNWYENNIIYSRRMALKFIYDDCKDFKNEDAFKERLESYFRLDEIATTLGQIAENGMDFESWFEIIDTRKLTGKRINNTAITLSRFLETYQYNVGLNYISGIIDLLNESNSDNLERLNHALSKIKELGDAEKKEIAIKTFKVFGNIGNEEAKEKISEVLISNLQIEGLEVEAYKLLGDNYSLTLIMKAALSIVVRKLED